MDVSGGSLRDLMPAIHAGMTEAVVNNGDKVNRAPVSLSVDSAEEAFALKFVQEDQIEKTGHLFVVLAERRNEIGTIIGSVRQEQRGMTRRPHASMIAS
jgi:hypothetical protein